MTSTQAYLKASRASQWHGVEMRVYQCPHCRNWHTSRKKRKDL